MVTVRYLTAASLLQAGAVPSPVLGLYLDGPRPGHGARTAVRVAGRPGTPWRHLTVDD